MAILIALGGCADEKLQATFVPDNSLPVGLRWDNAISLQGVTGGDSDIVEVLLHAGRATTASDTDPNAPPVLVLPGITRVRATLLYKPEVLEFTGHSAGDFFEQSSGSLPVSYNVTAETGPQGPTGRLLVDVSVASSSSELRKADFVKLEFVAVDAGLSRLQFEGGFGSIERNGVLVTGSSYYGGLVGVVDPNTQ